MVDPDLPSEFDAAQGDGRNVAPASDADAIDSAFRQERRVATDGDGAMVGRVLIYSATIVIIVVVVAIWKLFT
jgi:hypothetical protein